MEFSDWITEKYLQWRGNRIGESGSIAKFAGYIGTSQQLMSEWMKKNGKIPSSSKYVNALVSKYGLEVYEVLGLDAPGVTSEELSVYLSGVKEVYSSAHEQGIDPESPEFVQLVKETFAKYNVPVRAIKE